MKIIEITGLFNKFKDEVLTEFTLRRLSSEEKERYIKMYQKWRELIKDQKPTADKAKEIKATRKEMMQIEDTVTYKQIINLRKKANEVLRSKDGRLVQLEAIEATIQKEIASKIGMGLFMSAQKKMDLAREIRKNYADKIKEIN